MRNGKSIEKGSRTALVTGGGSGIGRCMARRIAALGYDLALAGSDAERLAETAAELMSRYGTDVRTFALDLATDGAAERLCRWADEERIEIDVLINNAGTFSFRDILSTPPERIRRMLYLHDMTVALTCRLLGERMAARGRGGYILNMASYSLWMPFPGLALYSASKAFVRSFSVAFAREVREAGIRVTAVCPAGVATDLYGLPAKLQRLGVRLGVLLTPDSCARRALRAMWRGRRCCVPGWWNRLFIPLCLTIPAPLLRLARKRTMKLQR